MEQSRVATCLATVSSLDGRVAQGLFEVRILSTRDKLVIALKRLAIFWGLAFLWLPVPMVHFLMVPTFLVIGIVAFAQACLLSRRIESARAICPSCQKPFGLGRIRHRERIKERCPNCRQDLFIRVADADISSEVKAGAYAALEERVCSRDDGHSGHELEKNP